LAALGDDTTRYQTLAANIFSLLLCEARFVGKHVLEGIYGENPNLLVLALALDIETTDSLIKGTNTIKDRDLLEICKRYQTMILSHCGPR
jgi:hypothetical protein